MQLLQNIIEDVGIGGSSTPTGTIIYDGRRTVPLILRTEADGVAQEGIETFEIPISIVGNQQSPPVFAQGPATITVIDRTGKNLS